MRAAILILGMAAQGGKGEGGAGVVAARMQLFPNDPALRWMQDLPPEMHVNDTNVPSFSTRENDALSPAKVHKSPRAATLDDTRKKKKMRFGCSLPRPLAEYMSPALQYERK